MRCVVIDADISNANIRNVVSTNRTTNEHHLDDESGLKNAGAILAGFGVSDTALLDVMSGKYKPQGKMPFALANNLQAILDNEPDVPGYPDKDTLYPFGHGLTY